MSVVGVRGVATSGGVVAAGACLRGDRYRVLLPVSVNEPCPRRRYSGCCALEHTRFRRPPRRSFRF
ncbi:Uncharacterised protein [Dermatophilus congolensis]|uniref:Uncharacterized protein n=1 Tax=Dermatophilus congolensis TaxID=1863 RepID=A0AA46BNI2_9MICO|nr:Uncharacterised protein [Dermatophilus congolensis]